MMETNKLLEFATQSGMSNEEFEKSIVTLYGSLMMIALKDQKENVQIRKSIEYQDSTLHIVAYRVFKEDPDVESPVEKMYKDDK